MVPLPLSNEAFAGEGLLEVTCEGSPFHSAIHTCGAAARLEHSKVSVSAAVFGDAVSTSMGAVNSAASDDRESPSRGQSGTAICCRAAAQVCCALSRTVSIGGFWVHSDPQQQQRASAAEDVVESGGTPVTCASLWNPVFQH
jgi:hypothetical protein